MARQKLLICGGTGFIGRNLVERYAGDERFEVYATHLTRDPYPAPGVTWLYADLRKEEDVNRIVPGMDVIVHAAATTSGAGEIVTRPYIHVTDNAIMNSLLLRATFDFEVKHFIFFSCTIMYPSSDRPYAEDDLDLNQEMQKNYFPAAWTKMYIEKMCEFYGRLGRTNYTVLRHSNIYGPHDKYDLKRSHVFGATVTKVMTAEDKITVWGTGEEGRDWLHVRDLVDCVDLCIEKQDQPCALFNVGRGATASVNDLVRELIEHSGKDIVVEHDTSRPTIPTTIRIDCARIKDRLGWEPRIGFVDGIKDTLNWYKNEYQKETT